MENSSTISSMNTNFLIDAIMSRLNGPSLAASTCASSDLHIAASNENLWENMCAATWPSTESEAAQQLFSSASLHNGFNKFYADAFPLILCPPPESTHNLIASHATSSDLASFVDIYYIGKCIFSKFLDAIPDYVDINTDNNNKADRNQDNERDELLQWPFRLDLLPYSDDTENISTKNDDDCVTYLDLLTFSTENGKRGIDLQDELAEGIRLSWILFNKESGKAVNISSWKPVFVHKGWALDREYVLHFGSIVAISDKFAECKIVARCWFKENSGHVKWTEISMWVVNIAGVHLNTTKSLGVLNQALYSKRTIKHLEVEKANFEYKMYKKEIRRRQVRRYYLYNKLYALVRIVILLTITCGCAMLFQ